MPPLILEQTAPAKINLGLHVLRKRSDGYHDLETVFLRIGWADRLRVASADDLRMTCSDPTLPTDDRNLCMQAAHLLEKTYAVDQGATIHLEKIVPHGAGLGGGSSDAATTLLLLNELWQLHLPTAALHPLAAQLGSDVPFFLESAAAYGTGRGEVLTALLHPTTQEPYRLPYPLVVIVPDVHVSTADAYRNVRPHAVDRPDLRMLVGSNDLAAWRTTLVNDFEASVFAQYPLLATRKQDLLNQGARYAVMSGSGSALFGVFPDEATAQRAQAAFADRSMRTWMGWAQLREVC